MAVLAGLVGPLAAGTGRASAEPGEDDLLDGVVFGGVTSPSPANITANPAALVRTPAGLHVFALGGLRLDRIAIDRVQLAPGGATSAGPHVADSTVGGAGVVGFTINPGNPVASFIVGWQPEERSIDRDATAYQSRGDDGRIIEVAAALSFRVTTWLEVGGSVGYANHHQHVGFARDTALEAGDDPARGVGSDCGGAACGFEHPLAREEWSLDVATTSAFDDLLYSLGAIVRIADGVQLALATRRPWQLGLIPMDGTATITEAPRDGGVVRHGEATVAARLPEIWRVGLRGRARPGWDALLELRWRRLTRTGPYDVHTLGGDLAAADVPEWSTRPRGLTEAFAAWVGAEQVDDGRRIRLGAWLGADSGATTNAKLSAAAPFGPVVAGAVGLQLRLSPSWRLQVGGQVRYQPSTSTGTSAFDPQARRDCIASGYDRELPACTTVRDGYGLPTAAGDYQRWSGGATVGLRIKVR